MNFFDCLLVLIYDIVDTVAINMTVKLEVTKNI